MLNIFCSPFLYVSRFFRIFPRHLMLARQSPQNWEYRIWHDWIWINVGMNVSGNHSNTYVGLCACMVTPYTCSCILTNIYMRILASVCVCLQSTHYRTIRKTVAKWMIKIIVCGNQNNEKLMNIMASGNAVYHLKTIENNFAFSGK